MTTPRERLAPLLLLAILIAGCKAPDPQGDRLEMQSGRIQFTDATSEAGLGDFVYETGAFGEVWYPESMGSGCGFMDYDGDGWQDLVLVSGGVWAESGDEPIPVIRLYGNRHDGTFVDVTETTSLAALSAHGRDGYGYGLAAADYDRDGDIDLFVSTVGRNILLRNDGGVFTKVAAMAGVEGADEWSASATFFDADRDGWPDLFVANYVEWSPETDRFCTLDGVTKDYCTPHAYRGAQSRFYRNNGDGTFSDATAQAGFIPPEKSLGVVVLDFNRDGWPDLAVSNDALPDHLYLNNGNGTFTEVGTIAGMALDDRGRARAGMGIDAGAVDSTLRETMFIGNFSGEMIGVYQYDGRRLFHDRAAASRVGGQSIVTLTFGLFLFDADLDGHLDVFAANGHLQMSVEDRQDNVTYYQAPHLFLNDGSGTFTDAAPESGGVLATPIVGRCSAYADYDRDGDLDVLVVEGRAGGRAHLWRNELRTHGQAANGNHFLRVTLVGRESSFDAIGAQVTMVAAGRPQYRFVRTSTSYLSIVEPTLTFGLGSSAQVDSLYVLWPSGLEEVYLNLSADEEIRIEEGTAAGVSGRLTAQ